MQDIQSSIPLTNKSEIDVDSLYNQIRNLSHQYHIIKLVFEYARVDKKYLIGVFPKFDFNIFGLNKEEEKLHIFKFNNKRKPDLKNLIKLINLIHKQKEIDIIDDFKNDNYVYDSLKRVIVRKINR